MKAKSEAHETLSLLLKRDGVPTELISDGAKEETKGKFRRKAREADMHCKETEPYSPWQNRAEGSIREVKRGVGRRLVKTGAPRVFWDYCAEHVAKIRSHTAHNIFGLQGEVPETLMKGYTADISPLAEFGWYDWCYFYDTSKTFPDEKMYLGRYLGEAPDIGSAMAARILKGNGEVVVRTTLRPLLTEETNSETEKEKRTQFDKAIQAKYGPASTESDFEPDAKTPLYDYYEDEYTPVENSIPERDDYTDEEFDKYIGAEVNLPRGENMLCGRVVSRKRDRDGNVTGKSHANPLLDSSTYFVEFPDGSELEYAANVIAESMYAQADLDGNQYLLLSEVVGHHKSKTAVPADDLWITTNGKRHMRKTTKGWQFCVLWKDGSTSWESLKDLKESNPVQVAEYAVTNKLVHEPAFVWWVPYTLKKRDRIIAKVNTRYLKKTHKFGIKLPKNVKEALAEDKVNGNTHWSKAIAKEMEDVKVAFKILKDDENVPVDYQMINCHMIFDVKMEDFRRKARLVAGGHMTDPPAAATYASVVSRESVRLALTIAALNDLDILTADVKNAYLNAPISERVYTICGAEFGQENMGKRALIVRALYGLKSAGAAFRNHLALCMTDLGYTSCLADPDVWMRPKVRADGFKFYEYVLIYVDDILAISDNPRACVDAIDKFFPMKAGSIGSPDIYLGAKVTKVKLPNGVTAWAMSPSKYIQEAVSNAKIWFKQNRPDD
jgi:hypothetical protein